MKTLLVHVNRPPRSIGLQAPPSQVRVRVQGWPPASGSQASPAWPPPPSPLATVNACTSLDRAKRQSQHAGTCPGCKQLYALSCMDVFFFWQHLLYRGRMRCADRIILALLCYFSEVLSLLGRGLDRLRRGPIMMFVCCLSLTNIFIVEQAGSLSSGPSR